VIDAWQLETWDAYRDVLRLGRKTRLSEKQRQVLRSISKQVRSILAERDQSTESVIFSRSAEALRESKSALFDFPIVDEARDVGVT